MFGEKLLSLLSEKSFDEWMNNDGSFWVFCVFWGALLSLISSIYLGFRIYGIFQDWEKAKAFPSLLITHLAMMAFFTIYAILNLLNFVSFYGNGPLIDCNVWYYFVVIVWHCGRICLYSFLLLRTHFILKGSFTNVSDASLSLDSVTQIPINVTYVLMATNAFMISFFLLNWIFVSEAMPIPNTGFCKRIITKESSIWDSIFYNLFVSVVALAMLIYRARTVTRIIAEVSESADSDTIKADSTDGAIKANPAVFGQIREMFQKHVILGFLTVIGSFVTCCALMFFHVLTGFIVMADTTSNIVLVHLMFTPDSRIYDKCCSKDDRIKRD